MKHKSDEANDDENDDFRLRGGIPCTEQQLEIISTCLLGGDDASRSFNQISSLHMRGGISVAALETALRTLVQRHGSFRTVFDCEAGLFFEKPEIDVLTELLIAGDPSSMLQDQLDREADHVFDLKKGPLFRFILLLGTAEHILIFNLHHLIFDGWTLGLTLRELASLYNDALKGISPDAEEHSSFISYALDENAFTHSEAYVRMKEYRMNKLRPYRPRSPLPCSRKRPSVPSYASDFKTLVTGEITTSGIRLLADQCGCSMLITLASLFELFLHRISGLPQIVTGIPAAGQPVSGFSELSGHCVYLLPVLTAPDTKIPVRDYLLRRKEEFALDFENRRVTYGSLMRELNPDRSPQADPIIPVTFNLYRNLSDEIGMECLETEIQIHPRHYSAFDMLINIRRNRGELDIECAYRKELFDPATVSAFLEAYDDFLGWAAENPDALMSPREEAELFGPVLRYSDLLSRQIQETCGTDSPRLGSPFSADQAMPSAAQPMQAFHTFETPVVQQLRALQEKPGVDDMAVCTAIALSVLQRYTGREEFAAVCADVADEEKTALGFVRRFSVNPGHTFSALLRDTGTCLAAGLSVRLFPGTQRPDEESVTDKGKDHVCELLITAEHNRAALQMNAAEYFRIRPLIAFRFLITESGMELCLEGSFKPGYAPDLNDVCRHAGTLLSNMLRDDTLSIETSGMADATEHHHLIYGLNQNNAPFRDNITLTGLFREQVLLHPSGMAVCDGNVSLSYEELDRLSDRIASMLMPMLNEEDEYVAVHMERGCTLVAALLAIHKTGKAYLPVEPSLPSDRKSVMLNAVRCSVVLGGDPHAADHEFLTQKNIRLLCPDISLDSMHPFEPVAADPEDIAYIIFTSGSTGVPKGVRVRHRSVVNLIEWVNRTYGVSASDKMLGTASVGFDLSVYDIFGILAAGACLRIARAEELREPRTLLRIIRDEKISFWNSAPAVMQQLLPYLSDADHGTSGDLRLAFLSGDWIPLNMPAGLRYAFPAIRVIALGGATEASIWSNYYEAGEPLPGWKSVPYGRPLQNARYYILDKALQAVPAYVPGDLYIAGEVLAAGYNDRDLSAAKFIPDPFVPGETMYRTGDRAAFREESLIEFLGRTDNQVKIRGYRIETGEIENVLMSHPDVEQAVVMPQTANDGQKFLAAFIRGKNNTDRRTLTEFASGKLPSYMIPERWVFMDRFPVNASGKTDRKKLSLKPLEDVHDSDVLTPSERMVAEVFSAVLGCSVCRRHDHFFDMGGHSLKAIEAIIRLEKRTGRTLSMSVVFTHPTVAGLAEFMDQTVVSKWKYIVPVRESGNKPPLYLVHGAGLGVMVFADLAAALSPEQPVFGIQAMGLAENEEPATDIESIAKTYLEELCIHNPEGPYRLAGFSAGSVIAFEMARQLRLGGKEVAFLGNFDFSLENLRHNIPKREKLKRLIPEFIPRQRHVFRQMLHHPKASLKFQKNFAWLRIQGILSRLGYTTRKRQSPGMDRIERLMEHYQNAFNAYRAKPYDGLIHLFSSRIKIYYLHDPVWLGWKPYALKGIQIHPVADDHDHMLLYPNSISFGKTLQAVLDDGESTHPENSG